MAELGTFRLGTATLGETLSFNNWAINGTEVPTVHTEKRKFDQLELTWRVDRSQLTSNIRPLDEHSGKLTVYDRDNGGFRVLDRRDGQNTYYLDPPDDHAPPRQAGLYLVDEYEEEMIDQEGERYKVKVTFRPKFERTTTTTLNESAGSGEFEFQMRPEGIQLGDFALGDRQLGETTPGATIATNKVEQQIKAGGAVGVGSKKLRVIFDATQTQVFEESASRLNAVRIRNVPDGQNVAEDNSPRNRNTVHIFSPDTDVIATGDYRVVDWETEELNADFYAIDIELFRA